MHFSFRKLTLLDKGKIEKLVESWGASTASTSNWPKRSASRQSTSREMRNGCVIPGSALNT